MATVYQNNEFTDTLLTEHKLADQSVYELKERYPLDAAIDFIIDNFSPADIFDSADLEEWAKSNGYVEQE